MEPTQRVVLEKDSKLMKTFRRLLLTGIALAGLAGPGRVWAQTSTTTTTTVTPTAPVGAPHDGTAGIPAGVRTLITSFDLTRDRYTAAEAALRARLLHAATAGQREQIRAQLQDNRQAFLAALKAYREKLQDDLTALKGKISHQEYLRIIDAAHDATTEGGLSHHKGH